MKTKNMLFPAVVIALCFSSEAAIAATTLSQMQVAQAKSAIIGDIQQNLQIFAAAAQKYAFENVGSASWNQNDSTTPIAYAPFLLYAGSAASPSQAASVCGFKTGSGTTVTGFSSPVAINGVLNVKPMANPVSWTPPTRFLPSKWNPAFKGAYCAVVTLNQPAAQQTTLYAYYVAPNGTNSASMNIQIAPAAMAHKVGQQVQMTATKMTDWKPFQKPLGMSGTSGTTSGMSTWTSATSTSLGSMGSAMTAPMSGSSTN